MPYFAEILFVVWFVLRSKLSNFDALQVDGLFYFM